MKRVKFVLSLICILGLLTGCEKTEKTEENEPQNPQLSHNSLSVAEGETSPEIVISGGVAPYITNSLNEEIVRVNTVSAARFTVTGQSVGNATVLVRGQDEGEVQLAVSVSADPHKAVKADASVRFKVNGQVYTPVNRIFVVDKGGHLFGSSQVKAGCSTPDGNTFFYIGWDGEYRSPKCYTENGVSSLSNLQCLQVKDGKIWLVGGANEEIEICTQF